MTNYEPMDPQQIADFRNYPSQEAPRHGPTPTDTPGDVLTPRRPRSTTTTKGAQTMNPPKPEGPLSPMLWPMLALAVLLALGLLASTCDPARGQDHVCTPIPARSTITIPPQPWTPPDTIVWYKTDAQSGFTDGQTVPYYHDSSSQGHSAYTYGGFQPTYHTNLINSLPGLAFTSATSNHLTTQTFTITQPYTLFLMADASTNNTVLLDGATPLSMAIQPNLGTTVYARTSSGSYFDITGCNYTNPTVLTFTANGANSLLTCNGKTQTGNAGTANATGLTLGGDGGVLPFLDGHLYEAGIIEGAASTELPNMH